MKFNGGCTGTVVGRKSVLRHERETAELPHSSLFCRSSRYLREGERHQTALPILCPRTYIHCMLATVTCQHLVDQCALIDGDLFVLPAGQQLLQIRRHVNLVSLVRALAALGCGTERRDGADA